MRDAAGDRPITPGDTLEVAGHRLDLVAVSTANAVEARTLISGGIQSGLTLAVRYDTVHIHRDSEGTFAINGLPARILTELALIGVPVSWQVLAGELWPDESDATALRRRWDTGLTCLRRRLREERVRPDLIRSDGRGNFEIFLTPHDRVDDQT